MMPSVGSAGATGARPRAGECHHGGRFPASGQFPDAGHQDRSLPSAHLDRGGGGEVDAGIRAALVALRWAERAGRSLLMMMVAALVAKAVGFDISLRGAGTRFQFRL